MIARDYSGTTSFTGNSGRAPDFTGYNGSGASFGAQQTQAQVIATNYSDEATGFSQWLSTWAHVSSTPTVADVQVTKSREQIEFENRKTRLIAAIERMKVTAPNWSADSLTVDSISAKSAEKFLNSLPGNARLPKVAPDGEGDVMFVWDDPDHTCVVTVEQRKLHLVSNPGTPDAKHVDSQQFLGVRIPNSILEYIPLK